MILQPAIIAILLVSLSSSLIMAGSAGFALRILGRWNLASGHENQINLERQTYLVATLLSFAMASQLAGLLLFVFNADKMAPLFVGAMCAVGVLNINPYGFPALILKLGLFLLSCSWLILNYIDNQGRDYPLIKAKYGLLLLIAPLALITAGVELGYYLNLKADVLTSCCSTLFGGSTVVANNDLKTAPEALSLFILWASLGLVFVIGLGLKHGLAYAVANFLSLGIALFAIVAVISVYIYEQPHHHCPFCILKKEYNFLGYALYLPLFLGTALGIGAGLAQWAGRKPSLARIALDLRTRFIRMSLINWGFFGLICVILIYRSNLILFGSLAKFWQALGI